MFIVTNNNEYINFNKNNDSLYIKIEEQKVSIVLIRQNDIHRNIFSTLIGNVDENAKICKTVIEDIIFNDEMLYRINNRFDYFKEKFF